LGILLGPNPDKRENFAMPDRLTLVAIAVVAYAIANFAHEGLGHGGACLVVGGHPMVLSAVHFEGDVSHLPASARRIQAAGGTLVNIVVGLGCLFFLRGRWEVTPGRYFLWLLATVNLLQAAGYWLFSGVGGLGDWAAVMEGLAPGWAWRLGLAVVGGAAYWGVTVLSLRLLQPFLGDGPDRLRRARALTVVPYVAGGLLYLAAGALNPHGLQLVLISAAAASFGGTSALAWMAKLLRKRTVWPPRPGPGLVLAADGRWRLLGLATAAGFIAILGPSVSL